MAARIGCTSAVDASAFSRSSISIVASANDRADMSVGFPEDVGVAIVCHNNREKLAATLVSLDAAGCDPARLLVVDVMSTDGTVEWLRGAHVA